MEHNWIIKDFFFKKKHKLRTNVFNEILGNLKMQKRLYTLFSKSIIDCMVMQSKDCSGMYFKICSISDLPTSFLCYHTYIMYHSRWCWFTRGISGSPLIIVCIVSRVKPLNNHWLSWPEYKWAPEREREKETNIHKSLYKQ